LEINIAGQKELNQQTHALNEANKRENDKLNEQINQYKEAIFSYEQKFEMSISCSFKLLIMCS
jgi:hypothetical protein